MAGPSPGRGHAGEEPTSTLNRAGGSDGHDVADCPCMEAARPWPQGRWIGMLVATKELSCPDSFS
jgi:hypothetical protein